VRVPTDTPSPHPRGLYTLFFTEMWERMSFYGMRGLLILFMKDQLERGGLGLNEKTASAIYGLYTAAVYLAALPGGWIADRLIGAQRAVWVGGLLIAAGHFTLAVPTVQTFYLGLVLVVLGTGLLKPNISAVVGSLYPEGGARRDAGFSIFYMGINLGAFIGPLVCSALGEKVNWHYGFAAAGVGMVFGLVQFHLTRRHLGSAGAPPPHRGEATRRDWMVVAAAVGVIVVVVGLAFAGVFVIKPIVLARWTTVVIVAIAFAYFGGLFLVGGLDSTERKRVAVIAVLFVSAAMFWSGFEQAGSSLNLFAKEQTQRMIASLKFEIPAGWFQSLNAGFIILLAPVAAATWVALGRRGRDPSLATKMGLGLMLLAAGFFVLAIGAKRALAGGPVWPSWLIVTYLLHTLGELCLSPVGLSSVTKLAPQRYVGQMMGVWFLAASLGNLIGGLIAGEVTGENAADMPAIFMQIVMTAGGTGLVLLVFAKPIRSLMPGIK
jgi:POT family proton-dependent oligopeptide transporter